MSARLAMSTTVRPGVFEVRIKGTDHRALAAIKLVNGKAIYGFDEETPDPAVEAAMASRSDTDLARILTRDCP